MFSPADIAKILFIDIETASTTRLFAELPPALQKMWAHKATTLGLPAELSVEAQYAQRAAIYAEFGRVVCVSVGFVYWQHEQPQFRLKSFYGADEAGLLTDLREMLDGKFANWRLCAHNGKEFDFPYLSRRFLIHQIPLPKMLQIQGKKPWEVNHLDTMDLWKFGDYKSYTKLELLCAVFDVPSPKEALDGSLVGTTFWEEGDCAKIARYCEQDVLATAQVLLRMSCLPLIAPEGVQSAL